jgi:hypothetical protein
MAAVLTTGVNGNNGEEGGQAAFGQHQSLLDPPLHPARLFRAIPLGSYWPTFFRLFRTSTIAITMAAGTITRWGF